MREPRERLIFPLDFSDLKEAVHWAEKLSPYIGTFKIGLELFIKFGPRAIEKVKRKTGAKIFLDLKLYDIPNTVSSAVKAAASYEVDYLTVHILSGRKALEEAVKAAEGGLKILGVTLLTSLDKADLLELGFNGEYLYKTEDLVYKLSFLAQSVGCDGIVCSAKEVARIKEAFPFLITVVPGIRLEETDQRDDQVRTATPYEAILNGADLLVVGRPIRLASDPLEVCLRIHEEIRKALEDKNV
ncbi:MAG: orotidine-5'-phosphate decarboxylase [Caldimicrobium sp.]